MFIGPVSNLKIKRLNDGTIAVLVSGQVTPEGLLYNPKGAPKPHSTGRVYTSLPIRSWDRYVTSQRQTIWYTKLYQVKGDGDNKYRLSREGPINALQNTGLETPCLPLVRSDDFDVSICGIAFLTMNPTSNPGKPPRNLIYYISLATFTENPTPKPRLVEVPEVSGDSSCPVLSPDGENLVFLRTKDPLNTYDTLRVVVMNIIRGTSIVIDVSGSCDGQSNLSLYPESLFWSKDGSEIYAVASETGHGKLFRFPLDSFSTGLRPKAIVNDGTVSYVSHVVFPIPTKGFSLPNQATSIAASTIFWTPPQERVTPFLVSQKVDPSSDSLRLKSRKSGSKGQTKIVFMLG